MAARFIFLFLCIVILLLSFTNGKDVPIPRYSIDLDLPPEERWKEVATDFGDHLQNLIAFFKKIFGQTSYQMLSIMAADLRQYFPQPYASELMSFVKYGNVTPGDIVVWNMLDELNAYQHDQGKSNGTRGCTSIVATMESGHILHGRNLDFSGPLRELAITVDFHSKGEVIYTGTTFAGYIGLMTAQKSNSFTFSEDDRYKGDWESNVRQASMLGTKSLLAFKIRDLLSDPNADFEYVVNSLASSELIAPCYLIVGGLNDNEGAVITHNRSMGIDVWRLNSTEGRWFLVQTNYDHWTPPPNDDNRRDPAIKMMNSIGQSGIDNETMFEVLSTPPVLNWGTMFTTIMSASHPDLYTGWLRNP